MNFDTVPPLTGALDRDAVTLAEHTAASARVLASLPAKPQRHHRQQSCAENAIEAGRRLRMRFMDVHADAVYDALTATRGRYCRIDEIAYEAAHRFPGLVPTPTLVAAERVRAQPDKDGHEVDHGILFWGFLRSPVAGSHLMDAMLCPSPRAQRLLDDFRREGILDLGTVHLERRGSAAHVTFNNTHCLNAEDERLVDDTETAVDLALLDTDVRVGVLRGGVMSHPRYAGRRIFSAGINVKEFAAGKISLVGFLLRRELGFISKIVRGLRLDATPGMVPSDTVHRPWVAVVDGFAIGGGMQLLLACDRVISADDAFFSLPAAQEGIVPGVANLRLGRYTGSRLSRRVILAGHRIHAGDPEAMLICDDVVPTAQIRAALDAAVNAMASQAVAVNRRLLNLADEPPDHLRAYLAEFALVQAMRLYSTDVLDRIGRMRRRETSVG